MRNRRFGAVPAALLVLGTAGFLAAQESKPTPISVDELKRLVDQKKDFFLLDVREPKEIEELGSLKGYVNIPIGQLEARLSEVPKDRYIIAA